MVVLRHKTSHTITEGGNRTVNILSDTDMLQPFNTHFFIITDSAKSAARCVLLHFKNVCASG